MSRHATDAPSDANRNAVARPSPEPAPVTIATRPSNRVIVGASPRRSDLSERI
jgi:hypothetical protein